jgi:hypothetical protein
VPTPGEDPEEAAREPVIHVKPAMPTGPRTEIAIKGAEGKRLTYRRTRGKRLRRLAPAPLALPGADSREPVQLLLPFP